MRHVAVALLLLAVWLLGVPAQVGAEEAHWARDWQAIQEAGRGITSLAAHFVQTKELRLLNKPLVSRGRLFFQSPGRIRWEYLEPVASVTLLDEDGVRRFVTGREGWMADVSPASQGLGRVLEEMKHWLAGDFSGGGVFHPRLIPGEPPVISLQPNPEMEKFLEEVLLYLGRRPGEIGKVEIREGQEGRTIMEFKELAINQPLPPQVFSRP